MDRFIINLATRASCMTVHDREHLTERCNTDDIAKRRSANLLEIRREQQANDGAFCPCSWCMPNGWPK